jgi:hypothetical protein
VKLNPLDTCTGDSTAVAFTAEESKDAAVIKLAATRSAVISARNFMVRIE